ncbi:MAG: hypothetical protein F6K16_37825 [Symploca sp. SIO2B6]|nr:hypothetical protein [Symploca sp. SIO2B6]
MLRESRLCTLIFEASQIYLATINRDRTFCQQFQIFFPSVFSSSTTLNPEDKGTIGSGNIGTNLNGLVIWTSDRLRL